MVIIIKKISTYNAVYMELFLIPYLLNTTMPPCLPLCVLILNNTVTDHRLFKASRFKSQLNWKLRAGIRLNYSVTDVQLDKSTLEPVPAPQPTLVLPLTLIGDSTHSSHVFDAHWPTIY